VVIMTTETRFLIVDDNDEMRAVVRNILASLSYINVTEAGDGADAWVQIVRSQAAGQPVEVVISDWSMPYMSGLDLLRKVRATKSTATLPFIMVTSLNAKDEVVAAAKNGVSAYITKPVAAGLLREKLGQLDPTSLLRT
jgi:two-component system chemotaxis response regulator CheY